MEDWFPARLNLDYANQNLAEIPHEEYLRRLEGRIMMFIRDAHTDGISHLELAQKVQINRKNLIPHMRRLMMKGLVVRASGKRGKYYPASKKYRGISVTADIFSKVAAGTILANGDFPIDSPYFDSKVIDENYPLDNDLFTFSNGVGAIITYMIIQSMNRSNEIPGRDAKNAEEQDINVNKWFNDGISTLGAYLLALFKEHMGSALVPSCYNYVKEDGTIDFDRAGLDFLNYSYTKPSFTLDEKSINNLTTSFCRTYPSICIHLDRISSRLPSAAIREIDRARYQRIRYRQQKVCHHIFGPPANKSLSARYQNNILHCHKCHKNKFVKKPFRTF